MSDLTDKEREALDALRRMYDEIRFDPLNPEQARLYIQGFPQDLKDQLKDTNMALPANTRFKNPEEPKQPEPAKAEVKAPEAEPKKKKKSWLTRWASEDKVVEALGDPEE